MLGSSKNSCPWKIQLTCTCMLHKLWFAWGIHKVWRWVNPHENRTEWDIACIFHRHGFFLLFLRRYFTLISIHVDRPGYISHPVSHWKLSHLCSKYAKTNAFVLNAERPHQAVPVLSQSWFWPRCWFRRLLYSSSDLHCLSCRLNGEQCTQFGRIAKFSENGCINVILVHLKCGPTWSNYVVVSTDSAAISNDTEAVDHRQRGFWRRRTFTARDKSYPLHEHCY